jgi:3-(3-hydroxy-phenyl)propionate hydroxylase
MLAGELALAGIDVVIVERRATQHVDGSRARGLHARAVEVLDQRGIAERFISQGQTHPRLGFGSVSLDMRDLPTRHNYVLGILQSTFEPILADWVSELGVPIMRRHEVTGFTQDNSGVTIDVSDGPSLRADYLVGCDGGRSPIRKTAGIGFPGLDASISYLIAEVTMDEEPVFGTRPEGGGIGKAPDGESIGVTVREKVVKRAMNPAVTTFGTHLSPPTGQTSGS